MHRLLPTARIFASWLVTAGMVGACGDDTRTPRPGPPPNEAPATTAAIAAQQEESFPPYPLFDDANLLRAPARFDHLVPRLVPPTGPRYRNLRYEANNVGMRGAYGDDGFYESTGRAIAERWRIGAAGTRGVFALRDALFSQQDHPIDHDPVSVMMPPSWVTVAVAETMAGRALRPVESPPLNDDDAWQALATPEDLFGSFPPSERLHEVATRPRTVLAPERLRVTNARRTVAMLAADARAMVEAAADGPEAVARAGAERISRSDRRYFGERVRREHIVLVAVENPNRHEVRDENKGLEVFGRALPPEAVALARRSIYARRLQDGDIAIERYHLGHPEERRRAIRVLFELLGPGSSGGHRVWVSVHGGLDARGTRGTDATRYIAGFRAEVADAGIDTVRVRYLSKPHVPIGGRNMARQLDAAARRFRQLDLPLSLNLGTPLLRRLFDELER